MKAIIKFLINGFSIFAAAYLLNGVFVQDFVTALIVALVLGFLNVLVKPILILLTLPINILTLGLFTLVINVFIVQLADSLVPGFEVDGFINTLLFSLVAAIISSVLQVALVD